MGKRAKKTEENYYLWADELTGKVESVEKTFILRFISVIGVGFGNRMKGSEILARMQSTTKSDARKLRGACHYLIHAMDILVVSIRSAKGGYFIAEFDSERDKYAEDQEKFATSMLRTAKRIKAIDTVHSLRRFAVLSTGV